MRKPEWSGPCLPDRTSVSMLTSAPAAPDLMRFASRLPQLRSALEVCHTPAFYFSAANLIPKIALGKLALTTLDTGFLLEGGDGTARLVPFIADRASYYREMLTLIEQGRTLAQVPEWAAMAWKKRAKLAKSLEYIIPTKRVQTLPGGEFKQFRKETNRARAACEVRPFEAQDLPAYLAINAIWYRQNVALKFRTYDKVSIDWLLTNRAIVQEIAPDVTCLGVFYQEKLVSFSIGSMLSEKVWSAYTRRFDRDCPIRRAAFLGYQTLGAGFADRAAVENNGTADTKTLQGTKEKFASAKLAFYKVTA